MKKVFLIALMLASCFASNKLYSAAVQVPKPEYLWLFSLIDLGGIYSICNISNEKNIVEKRRLIRGFYDVSHFLLPSILRDVNTSLRDVNTSQAKIIWAALPVFQKAAENLSKQYAAFAPESR